MRRGNSIKIRWIILQLFLSSLEQLSAQPVDTIYYNQYWQISEKPFAVYYRHGSVVYGNPFLMYKGSATDYYADGNLQMEGTYSDNGKKAGVFHLYYPNGKLQATGSFVDDKLQGAWTYYYSNGEKKALVNHNGTAGSFNVMEYIDSTGHVFIKNGSGMFELYFFDSRSNNNFKVTGEMQNGKRQGAWKYYAKTFVNNSKEIPLFKEVYEKGTVKKMQYYSLYGDVMNTYYDAMPTITVSDFEKFWQIDQFATDPLCFPPGKTDSDSAAAAFLIGKNSPVINTKTNTFEESFTVILEKLNSRNFLRNFKDPEKNYSGKILFNIADSGALKDIEITGNLAMAEKEMLDFIMKKFRNIRPLQIENVEIDANHIIYFYTVESKDVIPKRYQKMIFGKTLIFTMIPYEKLVTKLKEDMKLRIETLEVLQEHINSNLRWQLQH